MYGKLASLTDIECCCGKGRMTYPHWPPTSQNEALALKNAVLSELAKGYGAKDVANAFLSKGREGAYGRLEVAEGNIFPDAWFSRGSKV
jgi:hypothetical protein